jgi:hypothetical protein
VLARADEALTHAGRSTILATRPGFLPPRRPFPPMTTRPLLSLSALVLLALAAGCQRARPAEAPVDRSDGALPALRASRFAPGAIRLDGRLDEPVWQRTGSTGPFVHPGHGKPESGSRVQATARLGWDDEHLYVGAVVYDRAPETPFGREEVDPHLWERASAIELMLQPGDPGDNTQYYEIQVDPSGAVWDTRFDDYNRPITQGPDGNRRFGHQEWTSMVRQAATVDRAAGHYTIELAIPWRAFVSTRTPVPPRAGDVWRVNLYSFRDGQRDSLAWSPLLGAGNFHRASRFGRVTFAP